MGRFLNDCKDCAFFRWSETIPKEDEHSWTPRDGYCFKRFPKGYHGTYGPNREGGPCWHGKAACFQFEEKGDQMTLEELGL